MLCAGTEILNLKYSTYVCTRVCVRVFVCVHARVCNCVYFVLLCVCAYVQYMCVCAHMCSLCACVCVAPFGSSASVSIY